MTVTKKIMMYFIIILTLTAFLGVYVVSIVGHINNNGKSMYQHDFHSIERLLTMTELSENIRIDILTSTMMTVDDYALEAKNNIQSMDKAIENYETKKMTAEEKGIFQRFKTSWESYKLKALENIQHIEERNYLYAKVGTKNNNIYFKDTLKDLKELVRVSKESAEKQMNNSQKTYTKTQIILITSILIFALMLIIIGMTLGRSIAKPIKLVATKMDKVSKGDLSIGKMNLNRKDEIGILSTSIDNMIDHLQHFISSIDEASDYVKKQSGTLSISAREVKEGASQVATTMEELTTGSESQATSSSELSEKMEQFIGVINKAYQDGKIVSDKTNKVIEITGNGSDQMKESVKQMEKIDQIVKEAVKKVKGLDDQSKEITQLIEVIVSIANKTNLLSLNAAIEAARAGEQGRGFAVVAGEVRNLSQQVSDSVELITRIVETIQKESNDVVLSLEDGYEEVGQGTKQIQLTGQTFQTINELITEMVERVQRISTGLKDITDNSFLMNHHIEEIASISEESAAGVEEVSASVEQTSSSMEEVSKSANDLEALAESLRQEIGTFKY